MHDGRTRDGVVCRDPHSRGVGHRRHAGLFALLLSPVHDEEEEEEEAQQDQHDDPRDGSDLVRVHLYGRAGQTVETAHHHHTSCRGWGGESEATPFRIVMNS